MKAYHTTLLRNVESIDALGLLVSRSVCARPAVWLHSEQRSAWAFAHVMKRHFAGPEELTVYEFIIDEDVCIPHGNGVWYTTNDVPPESLIGRVCFQRVATPLSQIAGRNGKNG